MTPSRIACLLVALPLLAHAQAVKPVFRAHNVDNQVQIGYGLAIADVQGDGKPDILLADKTQFVWYEAPHWDKHVLAENLTKRDNVCIAARDIDGDGKCEIAVGAEWNPSDTVNSGAVFYLIAPEDRKQKWEPVKLPHEPTVHRMKWVRRSPGRIDLVVLPLHGRGTKDGEGEGVRALAYRMPKNPRDEWKTEVISSDMHLTHNFDVVPRTDDPALEAVVIGGREGLTTVFWDKDKVQSNHTLNHFRYEPEQLGFGEVRAGRLSKETAIVASIEPMHGSTLAVYFVNTAKPVTLTPQRGELDTTLKDGHALACGDLVGLGRDQIVVGWRANAE
ncbi:MAG: FG-GAP repeat domain-containing protein, partial [Roseimicrobium sp.]